MKAILKNLVAFMLLSACKQQQQPLALPFYNTPDFTPVWLSPDDDGYKTIHTIVPFSLTDQLGAKITNRDTKNKIYVANFFFTSCPAVCPRMMSNLANVQQAFANNNRVLILSHSVTPLKDSVPVLMKYASAHHINGKQWHLLTGNQDAIYKLARRAYFADDATGFNKGTNEFLHTENLVLIDGKGRIRGVYNSSLTLEVQNLIAHIKLLLAEEVSI